MLKQETKKLLGKYLVEIKGGQGWNALKTITEDIVEGAMENLKISEEGGDKNRGKILGLEELFDAIDECIKRFSEDDEQ